MANIGDFLSKETAGLPNWAWGLVVVAGLGATIILPKFFGGGSAASTTTGADTSGATTTDTSATGTDPFAGYNYGSSSLPGTTVNGETVPILPPGWSFIYNNQGQVVGVQAPGQTTPTTPTSPTPTPAPPPISTIFPVQKPVISPVGPKQPAQPAAKYVSVQRWPATLSTLSGIAQGNGISLTRIEQLNPGITNPNLIYPGQKVRVA